MDGLRTRVCAFELREPGYVHALVDDCAEMELADAQEALQAIWEAGGRVRRPTLVDMRRIKGISRDARDHFQEASSAVCTKVAMVVGSPVGRVIGNFFLRTRITDMPNRLFNDDESAVAWLFSEAE